MAKKVKQEPSIYRFMSVTPSKGSNYHLDFSSKEEAITYIQSLDESQFLWYGLYEISANSDHLTPVLRKKIKYQKK